MGRIWINRMRLKDAPEKAGGGYIVALAQKCEGFCAHQAGHAHPGRQADDHHDVEQAGFQKGDDRQNQEKGGSRA